MSLDLNLRTQTISSKCPGQTFMGLSSKLQPPSHKLSICYPDMFGGFQTNYSNKYTLNKFPHKLGHG